jgi:deoxyribonuclease (pyrimidine dimer)
MTRINLVPPSELTDQHLFAEFREIKMVPKSLARSLRARGLAGVLKIVPAEFTLNKGHVSFFYDKGCYLQRRYQELRIELAVRGVNFDKGSEFDPDDTFFNNPGLLGRYTPTPEALKIIRDRIAEKIAMKPNWYRYNGKPLTQDFYD